MSDPPVTVTTKQGKIFLRDNEGIVLFRIESDGKDKYKHRGMDYTVEKYRYSLFYEDLKVELFVECRKISIV